MKFISTAGHGYLQVTHAQLRRSGFLPSTYSFLNKRIVLLEEDCDAQGFLDKEKEEGRDWQANGFKEVHQSDIRRGCYERCTIRYLVEFGVISSPQEQAQVP